MGRRSPEDIRKLLNRALTQLHERKITVRRFDFILAAARNATRRRRRELAERRELEQTGN